MDILGADHIAVNVVHMEKSKKFYGETLQLKEGAFVDMGDHVIQYFWLDTHQRLELIQYKFDTDHTKFPVENRGIYRHLALQVRDIRNAYEQIKANQDIEIMSKPEYCEKLMFTGFLLKDPNGVEIEILQRV